MKRTPLLGFGCLKTRVLSAGDVEKSLPSFEKLSRDDVDMDDDAETAKGNSDKSYAHGGIGIHRKINGDKVAKVRLDCTLM